MVRTETPPDALVCEGPWCFRGGQCAEPIDLIPDFIPVLGYVDDVLLLPGLIWLAIRFLPTEVLAECRAQADEWMQEKGSKPSSRAGVFAIVALWLAVGAALWFWLVRTRL